jgi:phage-related protein
MHQSLSFIARRFNTALYVSGTLMPIIRSLSTAVAALVYRWNVVVAVLLVVVGPVGPTTLLPPRSNGKPEAATAVDKFVMMGMRMPETC